MVFEPSETSNALNFTELLDLVFKDRFELLVVERDAAILLDEDCGCEEEERRQSQVDISVSVQIIE